MTKILAFCGATSGMAALLLLGTSPSHAGPAKEKTPHPELGSIEWTKGYEKALATSKATGKPVFILFDEVPGCATVQSYAVRVLNNPFIVSTVEEHFVPLFVKNNGNAQHPDTKILKKFGEPSWNNPVVRIVDHNGNALAKRLNGDYSILGTALNMKNALRSAKHKVPDYLQVLIDEEKAKTSSLERVRLSMYCFWSGEVALGSIPGVLSTSPGHLAGREVVEVHFDPNEVSLKELLATAKTNGLDFQVFTDSDKQTKVARTAGFSAQRNSQAMGPAPRDDKYQLQHSKLSKVQLSPVQKMRVNAALGKGQSGLSYLTPAQRALSR